MKRFKHFLENVKEVLRRPEMAVLPGHLAFFFVLSVVPTITLISYGASFLNLPIDFISNFITKAFGSDLESLLMPLVSNIDFSFGLLLTIITGYYIASNGAASIIVTSNEIYGIPNSGFFKRRVKGLIMTVFIVLLFLFMLIVPVFGNKIVEAIQYVNMNPNITSTITYIFKILQGPIAWFIIFLFIKIIYTMAPDKEVPSSNVNYGAVFTTVLWIIVTAVYSYYVNHFAHYNVFYGGLASIVVLMLWVYFLAYIFVIGIALNYREEVIKLEKTGTIEKLKQEILQIVYTGITCTLLWLKISV